MHGFVQIISITLNLCFVVSEANGSNAGYRLMHLVSTDKDNVFQVGEKHPFKNIIYNGWVLESDKLYNIRLTIQYQKPTGNLMNANQSSSRIFFTTNTDNCSRNSINDDQSEIIDFDYDHMKNPNSRFLEANIQLILKYSVSKYHACLSIDNDEFRHQGIVLLLFFYLTLEWPWKDTFYPIHVWTRCWFFF
jgi:hypothetical protein